MTDRQKARVTPRTLLLAAGIVIVALLTVLIVDQCSRPAKTRGGPPGISGSATPRSGLATIGAAQLPPAAVSMLALIDAGGPFRFAQDNTVFSNNEGLLPKQPRGYYREYTVATVGSTDRGTRRLVVGQAGDVYYTSDHYQSFRQVIR